MLGKLLKYEIKGTARHFLPLFGAMLALSLLIRMMGSQFQFGPGFITGLFMFVEIVMMIALGVMAVVITIQRFYKNLLGQEGYLMFTLPVSTHQNILAKLIAATLWVTASGLLIALAIIIMVWENGNLAGALAQTWHSFCASIPAGLSPVLALFEWTLIGLLFVAANILFLYLAMAIGQLFNERKFLASFIAYIVLQFIQGFVVVIIANIFDALPSVWFRGLSLWVESFGEVGQIQLATLTLALGVLITGSVYYFFTHRLLHRKLNLT